VTVDMCMYVSLCVYGSERERERVNMRACVSVPVFMCECRCV
jgi:hypothetical protein